MSLRIKIFLLTAVLVATSVSVAAVLVLRQITAATLEDAVADLLVTVEAIEQLAQERSNGLEERARLLVRSSALTDTLDQNGRLQQVVDELHARLAGVDLFMVLDPAGRVAAASRLGADGTLPSREVQPIRAALQAEGARGVWILGDNLYELVGVPVFGSDGVRRGAVVLGRAMGDPVARRLYRLTRSHVLILADDRVVASSLPPGATRTAAAWLPQLDATSWRQLAIDDTPYLVRLTTKQVDYGGMLCNHIILRSQKGAVRLTGDIRRGLLVVGLLALATAFLAAWLGARRLGLPLGRLAARMAAIARSGNLDESAIAISGGPEVELFQDAFRRMLDSIEHSQRERERSYVEAVGAVMAAIDRRDDQSAGHSYRVAYYATALARELGVEGEALRTIEWGALLHDVGKIAVPDAILRKSGPLTEEEWLIMRQHPGWGYEILADVRFLQPALDVVYNHHERWDGSGYPRGLAGEEIPLAARIFAVVDTYDAITSDRHYRSAKSHRHAVLELQRVAGTQLDPRVVAAFLRIPEVELRRLRELSNRIGEGSQLPSSVVLALEAGSGRG